MTLQGNQYKSKETHDAIVNHEQFRNEYLGADNALVQYKPVADLINSGMFYISGVDKNFRPVLVFNAKKIDIKDIEKSFKASILLHETLIQTMFLPGQVESWNIIYDLAGMGITEIPTNVLKTMIQKMSSNYGGRLWKLWIVNAPMTVSISWKIVSTFMDAVTT